MKKLICNNGKEYSSVMEFCREYEIPKSTVHENLQKKGRFDRGDVSVWWEDMVVQDVIEAHKKQKETLSDKQIIKQLTEETIRLKKQVEIKDALKSVKPSPIVAKYQSSDTESTAVCLFSDLHLEKDIDPETVGFLNEYNIDIAIKRAEKFFIKVAKILEAESHNTRIEHLVLGVLGDLIEGELRLEASQTNNASPLEAIMIAKDILIRGLEYLDNNTTVNKITVITCIANHSRNTQKIHHTNQAEVNLEYMIYKDIQRVFANKPNTKIEVIASKSALTTIDIYGKNISFTHGHHTRYLGGCGGIMIPLNKYFASLNNRQRTDLLCIGHYHDLLFNRNIIVNGSICGTDSFAYNLNLPHQEPQQAFFLINQKYGISKMMPIFCKE